MPAYAQRPAIYHGSNDQEIVKRSIEQWLADNVLAALPNPPYPAGSVVWQPAGFAGSRTQDPAVMVSMQSWMTPTRIRPGRNWNVGIFNKSNWNAATLSIQLSRKLQQNQDVAINALHGIANYVMAAFNDNTFPIVDFDEPGQPVVGYIRSREPSIYYVGEEPGDRGVEKLRIDVEVRWIGLYARLGALGSGAPVGVGIGVTP